MQSINKKERKEISDILEIIDGDVELFQAVVAQFMIEQNYRSIKNVIDSRSQDEECGERFKTLIKIEKERIDN